MESYIVRVYRRNQENLEEVAGLVETVGTDEKTAFQSFSGLVTAIRRAMGRNTENTQSMSAHLLPYPGGKDAIKKRAG